MGKESGNINDQRFFKKRFLKEKPLLDTSKIQIKKKKKLSSKEGLHAIRRYFLTYAHTFDVTYAHNFE